MLKPDTGGPYDTFSRYEGIDGCMHRRFRLSDDDYSPTVRTDIDAQRDKLPQFRSYNPLCSGCYFGAAHSTAYHDDRIA